MARKRVLEEANDRGERQQNRQKIIAAKEKEEATAEEAAAAVAGPSRLLRTMSYSEVQFAWRNPKHQIAELETYKKAAEKDIADLKTRETTAIWKAEDAKLRATAASQAEGAALAGEAAAMANKESALRNEREVRGLLDAQLERVRNENELLLSEREKGITRVAPRACPRNGC